MTTTNDIKTRTLQRALNMLSAVGARYGVEFDGAQYGEPLPSQRKPHPEDRKDLAGLYRYVPIVDGLNVGDVASFTTANIDDLRALASTVSARGRVTRGPGGLTTHTIPKTLTLEVMAVLPYRVKETADA